MKSAQEDAAGDVSNHRGVDSGSSVSDGSRVDAVSDARVPLADARVPPPDGAVFVPDARTPLDAGDRGASDAHGTTDGPSPARADAAFDASSLAMGLVGYWKLDEGTGGISTDSSGNGNDGLLEAFSQTDWRAGHRGSAVDFGYAWMTTSYTASVDSITTATTIAAWVKPDLTVAGSGAPTGTGTALQRQTGTTSAAHFALRLQDGHVEFSGSGVTPCTSGVAVPVRQWTHIGAAFDGVTISVYINGQIDTRCPATVIFGSDTTPVTVGAALRSTGMSDGLFATIDDIVLFNRALSSAEMAGVAGGGLQ